MSLTLFLLFFLRRDFFVLAFDLWGGLFVSVLLAHVSQSFFVALSVAFGIGHAVYTLSDPRAVLLKEMARQLAAEKGRLREFEFLERLERLAIQAIYREKGNGKHLCANVDFYSGFVYELTGLPRAIYTPLFAMSRIAGWCAHRNEEILYHGSRIIRPAYRCVR